MARPEDLTVDYKKLLRLSVADRVQMARSPIGQSYLASLTPSQYNSLFPSYYKNSVPSYSAVSAGGGGGYAPTPSPSYSGGGTTAPTTTTPSTPSSTTTPAATKPGWLQRFESQVLAKTDTPAASTSSTVRPVRGGIDRSKFHNEMKDPKVREMFYTMMEAEVGSMGRAAHVAFAETVFNRAQYQNKSLKQILSNRDYYQPYKDGGFARAQKRMNDQRRQSYSSVLDEVGIGGSNTTDGASHNASGSVARNAVSNYDAVPNTIKNIGGETFYSKTFEQKQRSSLPRLSEDFPSGPPTSATGIQQQPTQPTDDAAETPLTPQQQYESRVKEKQSSIRNKPLTSTLKSQLDYAAQKAGVEVEVFSGGQMSIEEAKQAGAVQKNGKWYLNGKAVRTGSTRHDKGNAADVYLWKDGRKLSANNPEDAAIMKSFVVEAMRAGVTGVGHANDYMGPEGIHLGGGNESVWGKKGGIGPSAMISQAFKEGREAKRTAPVNPFEWQKTEAVAPPIKEKPEGYDNLPESLRNEIDALPINEKNHLYGLMQKAKESGIDPISGLTTAFEASKNDPTAVVQTITESPPGELPNIFTGDVGDLPIPEVGPTGKVNRFSREGKDPTPRLRKVNTPYGNISVDESSAVAFKGFLTDMHQAGAPLKQPGSYNRRRKRWSGGWSEHAHGNAIDFDDQVFFSKQFIEWQKNNPGKYEELKNKWGIIQPLPQKDPAHHEFGGTISQQAADMLAKQRQPKDDATETPLTPTVAPQQAAPQAPTPMVEQAPQSPTATPVVSASAPPSVRFQDMDLGGAKRPNFTEAELEAINLTPGAAEKIAKGIRDNPLASSMFASSSAVRDGVLAKSPELKNFSNLPPEEQQKRLNELRQKAAPPTPTPEQPKQEQTAPTATPTEAQTATPTEAPKADAPAPEAAPKTEEKPKALATGGLVDIPPGEDIAGVNMKTGKTEFYANSRESVSVNNGRLKVDPASLVNNDQPSYGNVQQEPEPQQQPKNMASMSSTSAPIRPNMSGVVDRFMNIHPDTPSAQRHVTQTYYDSYRRGTNFNMG